LLLRLQRCGNTTMLLLLLLLQGQRRAWRHWCSG
jgi:hypothetical protein